MRLYKKILLGILILFLAVQFIRPARNISAEILPTDITKTVNVPAAVLDILKRSCYDCHSNNTEYPWYVNIQPIGWWLNKHIKDGKRHLNFSEFGTYTLKRQKNKLHETGEETESGGMPLSSYTKMHKDAIMTAEEKILIKEWAQKAEESLSAEKNAGR